MKVVFTFGRFNPPTIGHQLLVKKVKDAGGRDYMIYPSQTQNAKKDPLDFQTKVEWMQKSFPECAAYINSDSRIKNVFDALVDLYQKKYTEVEMIVGSDRVDEFRRLIEQYNDKEARHGYYKFMRITVTSAGDRDPDSDDVSGMSASKMREAAAENDFDSFSRGTASALSPTEKQQLLDDVREGLGILEERRRRPTTISPERRQMRQINQQVKQLNDRKKALIRLKDRLRQRTLQNKLSKMRTNLRDHKEYMIDADDTEKLKKIEKKIKAARKKWSGEVVEVGTDKALLKYLEMLPKHYLEGE